MVLGVRTESPDNDSAFSDNVSMLSSESSASSGGSGGRTDPNKSSGLNLAPSPTQVCNCGITLIFIITKWTTINYYWIRSQNFQSTYWLSSIRDRASFHLRFNCICIKGINIGIKTEDSSYLWTAKRFPSRLLAYDM